MQVSLSRLLCWIFCFPPIQTLSTCLRLHSPCWSTIQDSQYTWNLLHSSLGSLCWSMVDYLVSPHIILKGRIHMQCLNCSSKHLLSFSTHMTGRTKNTQKDNRHHMSKHILLSHTEKDPVKLKPYSLQSRQWNLPWQSCCEHQEQGI